MCYCIALQSTRERERMNENEIKKVPIAVGLRKEHALWTINMLATSMLQWQVNGCIFTYAIQKSPKHISVRTWVSEMSEYGAVCLWMTCITIINWQNVCCGEYFAKWSGMKVRGQQRWPDFSLVFRLKWNYSQCSNFDQVKCVCYEKHAKIQRIFLVKVRRLDRS